MTTGNDEIARKRPRRRWLVATVVLLVAAGAVFFVVPRLLDLAVRPWAFSLTGGPTLTGTWAGELQLAPDDVRTVSLHLKKDRNINRRGGNAQRSDIEGTAAICDATGAPVHFTVDGDPEGRSGSRFWLELSPGRLEPGTHVSFGRIDGVWDGDTLRLHAKPETIQISADGAASGSADTATTNRSVDFTLTRAADGTDSLRCASGR
jgi:hypothetical protein